MQRAGSAGGICIIIVVSTLQRELPIHRGVRFVWRPRLTHTRLMRHPTLHITAHPIDALPHLAHHSSPEFAIVIFADVFPELEPLSSTALTTSMPSITAHGSMVQQHLGLSCCKGKHERAVLLKRRASQVHAAPALQLQVCYALDAAESNKVYSEGGCSGQYYVNKKSIRVRTLAKHHVAAIQPGRLHGADEELRAVGVAAGIGHGQHARARVRQIKVLIFKLGAIDAFASSAVASREVAALHGEASWQAALFAVLAAVNASVTKHHTKHVLAHVLHRPNKFAFGQQKKEDVIRCARRAHLEHELWDDAVE